MNNDNYDNIYCVDDDEYRVYCQICEKLCFERFHKNHPKSGTHANNIHKRQQLKNFKYSCYI